MEKLLIIDGSNLLHRAFYALPLLSNRQGEYTNAVYGFMMMLEKLLQEENPSYAAICFDKSRITFRNKEYAAYKMHRPATPAELSMQFALMKEVLDAYGIAVLELDQYEADDIIGTLAKLGETHHLQNIIGSGDKDLLQLISPDTVVALLKKGISERENYDLIKLQDVYGLTPQTFVDFKALMGDPSDNIPGVSGVGEKTALKLLHEYQDLDDIYAHLSEIKPPKLQEKLEKSKETAYLSKRLATICVEVPLDQEIAAYRVQKPDYAKLQSIYTRLNFKSLLANLPVVTNTAAPAVPAAEESVTSLPQTEAEWIKALDAYRDCPEMALSVAWQGQPLAGDPKTVGIAAKGRKSLGFAFMGQMDAAKISLWKNLLTSQHIKKITVDAKNSLLGFAALGYPLAGIVDDLSLAGYLLRPESGQYDTVSLARTYLQEELPVMDEARQAAVLAEKMVALRDILLSQIAACGMEKIYREMELPLAAVLAQMEQTGVRVEASQLAQMAQELEQAAQKEEKTIYTLADMEFNINSPKQLGFVLFEKLGLPTMKKTKTGFSTSAEVLEELAPAHEIIQHILDYRNYMKLKSTYAVGLAKAIGSDGKLHTSFLQTGTATGRLASAEPNLQNIPIRMELGRQIRRVFVPEKEGDMLLAADYSQIELRVMAHISEDPILNDAFWHGEDVHARTAAEVFGVPLHEVTGAQRRQAKAVNFGIIYGISDYGLSRNLGISRKDAKVYMDAYFAHYPKVLAYQKQAIATGKKQGYVTTILGRRRYLPDLANSNYNLRSFAERMALNTPIQGTAADIIKIAMVQIAAILAEKKMRSTMILQVHDELIFNMVPEEADRLPAIVKDAMEHAMDLRVPLRVDLKIGPDWYRMQKMEIEG